ncbi:hypothetical protein SERLA73DRAFT_75373 [Serpula lacrymans var. lacrymans S7.3]|uniref:Uncharacterized protein n=2 Tax=Serpula lacrymans var. lacrymans TaxID=341189 RepID=F8Q3G5_SERL3|nr:uncharacterized protein SERLADRAFT_440046 [Serpula lacrymans var. lacrymans S7.9]EGN97726.1 hypothetical protein SERLA73DRAFT_75373 [Serpula lacrymans var. lacrymans S7.3]EGO23315.1 hypothetical protein SERLADRAFT_440046 [Serpula lacrymans var. lacrymans S7.9]
MTGKQRIDNLKMIKIEENTLITEPTKAKNSNLPQGCLQGNRWRSVFIPTYEKLLGTTENPWMASDHKSLEAIQATWNTVYPDIKYRATLNDAVCHVHLHSLNENTAWPTCIRMACNGATAYAMVDQLFESEPDFSTYEARQEFSKSMVSDLAFLYANLGDKISDYRGVFRSPFILQTFASHLNSINGAINVEALRAPGTHEQSSDTDKFPPLGALAMSAAAIERILTLWANHKVHWEPKIQRSGQAKPIKSYLKPIPKLNKATGKETGSHGNFSETNWGTVTRNYHTSMKKLQLGTLEDIVEQAQVYVKGSSRCGSEGDSDEVDPRACLMDI